MAVHETLHDYYLHQHRNIVHYLEKCKGNADMELVHELRLSIKKLRAFNKLADQLCLADTDGHIQIKNSVKQLYKLAGQIRDLQVQTEMLSSIEKNAGVVYPEFGEWLRKRERKRIDRLFRKPGNVVPHATAHFTHEKIGKSLALATDLTVLEGAGIVSANLFAKAIKLSADSLDDRNMHRIRIITKQLRYIMSIMQHSYPHFKISEMSVHSSREIEAATGYWHDCLVQNELLSKFIRTLPKTDDAEVLNYEMLLAERKSVLDSAFNVACNVVQRVLKPVVKG